MTSPATLFLIVGLPGAGKTTRARELEKSNTALRFSPDEWMIPPFGDSDADGKRDLLEGLLINAGLCDVHESFLARPTQTFQMTDAQRAQWRAQFQEPTAGELAGAPVPDPPSDALTLGRLGSTPFGRL